MPAIPDFGDQALACRPELRHQTRVALQTALHLPAIAARRAPADAMGFEQHNLGTTISEEDGCRQARETATDNADIGFDLTLQLGIARGVVSRRGVVGSSVVLRSLGRHTRSAAVDGIGQEKL